MGQTVVVVRPREAVVVAPCPLAVRPSVEGVVQHDFGLTPLLCVRVGLRLEAAPGEGEQPWLEVHVTVGSQECWCSTAWWGPRRGGSGWGGAYREHSTSR